jgi:hypothetical protein
MIQQQDFLTGETPQQMIARDHYDDGQSFGSDGWTQEHTGLAIVIILIVTVMICMSGRGSVQSVRKQKRSVMDQGGS